MAKKGGYDISDIYQGGVDSFKSNYGDIFTGYHVPASSLGATTNPTIANQISEVSKILRQGTIPIEVGSIKPEIFEAIPKQHFKEINRMAKLTGAKISMHAPLIEASGIGERGWSEDERKLAERQLLDVVEKAHDLDPSTNVPVTIHSANIPGTEYKIVEEGGKRKKVVEKMVVINQDTGEIKGPIKEDVTYFVGAGEGGAPKKEAQTPEDTLRTMNNTEWNSSIREIEFSREGAERVLSEVHPEYNKLYVEMKIREMQGKPFDRDISNEEWDQIKKVHSAAQFMEQSQLRATAVFDKVYKEAQRKIENGTSEERELYKQKILPYLDSLSKKYSDILGMGAKDQQRFRQFDPGTQSHAMFQLIKGLEALPAPQTFVKVEDFATRESSKTFANVAFEAYKKFGDKAPIVSIENLYPGFAFSTGKEMDKLIVDSRKKFAERLIKEKGVSKSEAQKKADKLIGLTFDVGHLNLHRKKGFEEKDLLKEFQEISKHTKHLHLTDNFGSYDSHLVPGMGNVPIKKYLEELEKKGFKGRKIVEAGGIIQQFGTSPYVPVLEAFGSPFYSDSGAGRGYWNQSPGLQQGYMSGYGMMMPSIHDETFGTGFSNLPAEFGGQRGGGNRMGGRPME